MAGRAALNAAGRSGQPRNPFRSFFMGGFECSSHINRQGRRLDLLRATGHDRFAERDYRRLLAEGIGTARDGLRWHLIDRGGQLDFSSFLPLLQAAARTGIQVIWDLCHYGWPDDLDIFSAEFVRRFAAFSRAAARLVLEYDDRPPLFVPVNEISYFAWAAGEAGLFHPFARGRAPELKRQLVRASLAAAAAIRSVAPQARLLTAEPVINVLPPADEAAAGTGDEASFMHRAQFEAWDMLAGRRDPGLGGSEAQLDVLGVNFYPHNQWELPGGRRIGRSGKSADGRWKPFRLILRDVWERYRRPLFIAETGSPPPGRADWLAYMLEETAAAQAGGIPVYGLCLYPIIDRPDWENPGHWHRSGLWDRETCPEGRSRLVLREPLARQLRSGRELLGR